MLSFRKADEQDVLLYFDWANDPTVREQSYNSNVIDFKDHKRWFDAKVVDDSCLLLVFQNQDKVNVGQIRIQKQNKTEALIGISISAEHRGKGLAKVMLRLTSEFFLENNIGYFIHAYIKEQNESSKHAFEKAGFVFQEMINYESCVSFHFIKKID